MKVTIGKATKSIPARYRHGIRFVREAAFDEKRVRLSGNERFRLAAAEWKHKCASYLVREYLEGFEPIFVTCQINRNREQRYVATYQSYSNPDTTMLREAIVTKHVYDVSPIKKEDSVQF